MPQAGIHSVTVPGRRGWLVETALTIRHEEIFRSPRAGHSLRARGVPGSRVGRCLLGRREERPEGRQERSRRRILIDGHAPLVGEVFRNPDLAHSLELNRCGRPRRFYKGEPARRIVAFSAKAWRHNDRRGFGGLFQRMGRADFHHLSRLDGVRDSAERAGNCRA